MSDRYYLRESPATFPVRGVLSFFTWNTCMNPSDAI
ncbi:50S ribosome-binding GTPase, partial [Escherichia coli]